MHIRSIQVENYKSFYKSQKIKFEKGINLIVGKNNVGKSALLELIGDSYTSNPHRSIQKEQDNTSLTKTPSPFFLLSVQITKKEVFELFQGSIEVYDEIFNEVISINNSIKTREALKKIEKELNEIDTLVCYILKKEKKIDEIFLNLDKSEISINSDIPFRLHFNFDNQNLKYTGKGNASKGGMKEREFGELIYFFNAERKNYSTHTSGSISTQLDSDTSNLPAVLANLHSNRPAVYDELVEWICEIFPEIHHISIQNTESRGIEIITWTNPKSEDRNDLNISLSESGKGVGQVLSILYVVLSSKMPQVILIDEPQSFLHPSAIKLLIDIFNLKKQHQYIIATHSPIIISYAEAKTIHLASKNNGVSEVKTLDRKAKDNISEAFASVGAQLSDYYGSNHILWVEGPTEQAAFRIIIRQLMRKSLRGITILPVLHTGDFEGGTTKDKKKIIAIYNRLSESSELLPPAIGFVFDKEIRTDQQLDDLKKLGEIFFIKRRMYENYLLLTPEAIAIRLNSVLELKNKNEITKEVVEKLINDLKINPEYWKQVQSKDKEPWHINIDAAKLLADVYKRLTDNKVEYRKVIESVELTRIIIEKDPAQLDDLKEMLNSILENTKK